MRNRMEYHSYLRSSEWQKKRQEFFECCLFEGFCAGCGAVPETYNIHHLTYSRLGEEYLEDLIALCPNCHMDLHSFHEKEMKSYSLYSASQRFIKLRRKESGVCYGYAFSPMFQRYRAYKKGRAKYLAVRFG